MMLGRYNKIIDIMFDIALVILFLMLSIILHNFDVIFDLPFGRPLMVI